MSLPTIRLNKCESECAVGGEELCRRHGCLANIPQPLPKESEQPVTGTSYTIPGPWAPEGCTEKEERWAVFCALCGDTWDVPYHHPGKSVCESCERKHKALVSASGALDEAKREIEHWKRMYECAQNANVLRSNVIDELGPKA